MADETQQHAIETATRAPRAEVGVERRRMPLAEQGVANETGESGPKISTPEVIIGTMILGATDLADIALPLIFPAVGEVLTYFYGVPVSSFTWIYLTMKRVKALPFALGGLADTLPFVNMLPMRTATFLLTAYVDRHPRAAPIVAAVEQVRHIS